MKVNIKLKDFLDKANLQGSLDTKLKKPVNALSKQVGLSLPFCYEAEYFEDGGGFLVIGETKTVHAHFKKQRVKGQGKDEKGKMVKIDKKKVAYGQVTLREDGLYEFLVEGGLMKKAQLKKVIKSIGLLKKMIGDKFAIITKATENGEEQPEEEVEGTTPEVEETTPEEESTTENSNPSTKEKALRDKKLQKIAANKEKLEKAVGVADEAKVKASIEKYQQALEEMKAEALENDGVIDEAEGKAIADLEKALQAMQERLAHLGGRKAKIVGGVEKTIQEGMDKAEKYVQQLLEKLEQAVSQ